MLNNHRAKLSLPGIADPDTLEYASRLIGDEGPRRLLLPEELRCLTQGRGVLVYGTLPPARLQLRPWWATSPRGPGRLIRGRRP